MESPRQKQQKKIVTPMLSRFRDNCRSFFCVHITLIFSSLESQEAFQGRIFVGCGLLFLFHLSVSIMGGVFSIALCVY